MRRLRVPLPLPVLIFLVWSALVGVGLLAATLRRGVVPVDFATYQRAAAALAHGASPYQTPAQSRAIWRSYHRLDAGLRAAYARGDGARALRGAALGREQPGPYLYPPTLALLVRHLHIAPAPWEILDLLAIASFPLLWLRLARLVVVAPARRRLVGRMGHL